MKKHFTKRIMAAALAVPFVLMQGTAVSAEEEKTYQLSFMEVEADPASNLPVTDGSYLAEEANLPGAVVQESQWNINLNFALNYLAGQEFQISAAELADSLDTDEWYTDFLKDALYHGGADVTAKVLLNSVVITITLDYQYGQAIADAVTDALAEEYPDAVPYLTAEGAIQGTITLTADTSHLTDKTMQFHTDIDLEGFENTDAPAESAFVYIKGILDSTEADILAAADDTDVQASIKKIFAAYQEKFVQGEEAFHVLGGSGEMQADTVTMHSAFRLFAQITEQINAQTALVVDFNLNDIAEQALSDVSASAVYYNYIVSGTMYGYTADEVSDYAVYADYFNTQLEGDGLQVVPESIKGVKVIEAQGNADALNLSGDAYLNIYRVVWYEETQPINEAVEETSTAVETTTSEAVETTTTAETTVSETEETTTTMETTVSEAEETTTTVVTTVSEVTETTTTVVTTASETAEMTTAAETTVSETTEITTNMETTAAATAQETTASEATETAETTTTDEISDEGHSKCGKQRHHQKEDKKPNHCKEKIHPDRCGNDRFHRPFEEDGCRRFPEMMLRLRRCMEEKLNPQPCQFRDNAPSCQPEPVCGNKR